MNNKAKRYLALLFSLVFIVMLLPSLETKAGEAGTYTVNIKTVNDFSGAPIIADTVEIYDRVNKKYLESYSPTSDTFSLVLPVGYYDLMVSRENEPCNKITEGYSPDRIRYEVGSWTEGDVIDGTVSMKYYEDALAHIEVHTCAKNIRITGTNPDGTPVDFIMPVNYSSSYDIISTFVDVDLPIDGKYTIEEMDLGSSYYQKLSKKDVSFKVSPPIDYSTGNHKLNFTHYTNAPKAILRVKDADINAPVKNLYYKVEDGEGNVISTAKDLFTDANGELYYSPKAGTLVAGKTYYFVREYNGWNNGYAVENERHSFVASDTDVPEVNISLNVIREVIVVNGAHDASYKYIPLDPDYYAFEDSSTQTTLNYMDAYGGCDYLENVPAISYTFYDAYSNNGYERPPSRNTVLTYEGVITPPSYPVYAKYGAVPISYVSLNLEQFSYNLNIKLVDNSGNPIVGAKASITSHYKKMWDSRVDLTEETNYTTDANSKRLSDVTGSYSDYKFDLSTVENLPPQYCTSISGSTPVQTYDMSRYIYDCTIAKNYRDTVEIVATPKLKEGKLNLSIVDDKNNNIVNGATYNIVGKSDTNKTVNITGVSSDVNAITNLPYGQYAVNITEAPEGYDIIDKDSTFSITEDGQVIDLAMSVKLIEGSINVSNLNFNNDKEIDVLDLAMIAANYNITSSDEKWDSKYDINEDSIIDIYDIVKVCKEIGRIV